MDSAGLGPTSRYATKAETLEQFPKLGKIFADLNAAYRLGDHASINRARYPWTAGLMSSPELYGARLWEYPYAATIAGLAPRMMCADVGCGESAFTIYLRESAGCEVIGYDPDLGSPGAMDFGVSQDFLRRTGLRIEQGSIDHIPAEDGTFDRVFCLSVIEHIPSAAVRARGMREIARVLKSEGVAVLTVDTNMKTRLVDPLELIWESGLVPAGTLDIRMPAERFGIFCDGQQPADVFGFVLRKCAEPIEADYGIPATMIPRWQAAQLRDTFPRQDGHIDELPPRADTWMPRYRDVLEAIERDLGCGRPSPNFVTVARIAAKLLLDRYGVRGRSQ